MVLREDSFKTPVPSPGFSSLLLPSGRARGFWGHHLRFGFRVSVVGCWISVLAPRTSNLERRGHGRPPPPLPPPPPPFCLLPAAKRARPVATHPATASKKKERKTTTERTRAALSLYLLAHGDDREPTRGLRTAAASAIIRCSEPSPSPAPVPEVPLLLYFLFGLSL